MKYTTKIIVSANEIEKAVSLQYGVNIDLCTLMWEGDFMNDCYKTLYFDSDIVTETNDDASNGDEDSKLRMLVYSILMDAFPCVDEVLVDVSW